MQKPGGMTIAVVALATAVTLIVTGFREAPPPEAPPDRPVTRRAALSAPDLGVRTPTPSPIEPGRIRGTRDAAPSPVTAEALQQTPIALMPANTVFAALASDYQRLTDQLGLAGLVERHRDMLGELDAELARVGLVVADLLDPTQVGIDTTSPMLLGVVGVDKPVLVLGARIIDEAALSRTVDTLAAVGELVETEMEQSQLLVSRGDRPRLGILRRAGLVYLLIAEGWDTDVMTVAAQITWQAPEDSLSTTPAWAQAFDGVRGDEGWIFVNGPAIHAELRSELVDKVASAAKELEEAAEDDPVPEWTRRQHQRAEAGLQLFEALFGGLGGIGIGVDLDGQAARVDGHVGLERGSLLQRMLANRPRSSALQRAMAHAPLYAVDGVVDARTLRELVELFAGVLGADLDRAMMLVKAFGGLDRDPLTLLSGELGVAVHATGLDTKDPVWSVTVTLGVTDGRDARKLIDHLGGLATMAEMVKYEPETGGVVIDVPHWRSLHLAVAGDAVVLSTELSAIDRVGGRAAPDLNLTGRRDVDQLLMGSGNAGTWLMDFDIFLPMLSHDYYFEPGLGSEDPATRTELERISRELRALHEEEQTLKRDTWTGIVHLLGSVGFSVHAEGGGMRLGGGWFWESHSPADLLAAVIDAAVESERVSVRMDARSDALYAERARLLQAAAPLVEPAIAAPH